MKYNIGTVNFVVGSHLDKVNAWLSSEHPEGLWIVYHHFDDTVGVLHNHPKNITDKWCTVEEGKCPHCHEPAPKNALEAARDLEKWL